MEEVVPKEPGDDDDDDCQIVMEVKKFKVPLLAQVKTEPLDNTTQADIQVVQGDSTPEKDQHTDEISNDLDKVITICVIFMVLVSKHIVFIFRRCCSTCDTRYLLLCFLLPANKVRLKRIWLFKQDCQLSIVHNWLQFIIMYSSEPATSRM